MNYTILYEKPAIKFIRKQPPAQQKRILDTVTDAPSFAKLPVDKFTELFIKP